MPKMAKQHLNSSHVDSNTTTTTPNYLSQPKPCISIPDPTGSRYSRRVRGLSESSKNIEDLDQVLSRKRVKTNLNDSANAEETFDHFLSDIPNACEPISNNEISEMLTKTSEEMNGNDIDVDMVVRSSEEVEGVKRNLEFGNSNESSKGKFLFNFASDFDFNFTPLYSRCDRKTFYILLNNEQSNILIIPRTS